MLLPHTRDVSEGVGVGAIEELFPVPFVDDLIPVPVVGAVVGVLAIGGAVGRLVVGWVGIAGHGVDYTTRA